MRWTMVKRINEMDYDLKEINEMDYGLKEMKWNVIIEIDNKTLVEVRLSEYVMIRCKPLTEQLDSCLWNGIWLALIIDDRK